MYSDTITLPPDILTEGEKYFHSSLIQSAKKAIALSSVSISFKKGTPETYFIVSGIIRVDRSHEAKVVFKKRLTNTPAGPLTSNCDCHEWSKNGHCTHTAALFLTYHLQQLQETHENSGDLSSLPPIPMNTSFGVNVSEYGTMIKRPGELIGAPPSATYSSLQYLLHNKKVIHFPLPDQFKGKLIINIFSPENNPAATHMLSFSHEDESGEHTDHISIFEYLYLFNWSNGTCFHLPSELKDFFRKIKIMGVDVKVNEIFKIIYHLDIKKYSKINIDGTAIEEVKEVDPHCRIELSPGDKNRQIEFKMIFHDENDNLLEVPEFLQAFSFTGGLLSLFKKKNDAYDFLHSLVAYDELNSTDYKKVLTRAKNRDRWLNLISYNLQNEKTLTYAPGAREICHFKNDVIRKMLISIIRNFKELFFRFSTNNPDKNELIFQVTGRTLFEGLNDFYKSVLPYGVTILYDQHEIGNWSSRIRFERKSSSNKWFDLNLNVDEVDIEIIKKADLETGLAVTKKGLVLLTKEQKDLLRFMKKYTQYEGKEADEKTKDGIHRFILPFSRARIFELFELKKMGIEGALTDDELKLCEKLSTFTEVPKYPVPENLIETIRPYQVTGYHWLRFLYENKLGACLADDMGLGKTLQTITFIQSIHHEIDKILIVCPVSILLNWEKEFKKFSHLNICIYHGGDRSLCTESKIILTSYGVMKKESETTFAEMTFDILVFDEVQHLKNIRSLGSFAARKIKADFRICLTGTPVENDLSEFYNIIDLSVPGIWGDLSFIRTASTKKSRLVARKTASPFILRRTKSQVLTDLPPKTENNVFLTMTEKEEKRYKDSLIEIRNTIYSTSSKKKYGEILRGLLRLRQSCLWQFHEKNSTRDFENVDSTKINFLLENVEQILKEGHQAIIFSQFTTYLDIIQSAFNRRNFKYSRIDGSQSIKKRQKQVDLFQEGQNRLFLISLKAGGVGLNLTAASFVFVMDPWWNPAVEAQAIDRAHRIGQKNKLTVYRPIIKGSIEEKVLKLQEVKKQLFKDLLPEDEDTLFTGKLSMKDFESLFLD